LSVFGTVVSASRFWNRVIDFGSLRTGLVSGLGFAENARIFAFLSGLILHLVGEPLSFSFSALASFLWLSTLLQDRGPLLLRILLYDRSDVSKSERNRT
jgi:hypothetical protein